MNMDNLKSYEFTFLYLINKCILLFKYIDNDHQKNIIYDIKIFINKLQELSLNKNKILEVLIEYFEKIIDSKIYKFLIGNKDSILKEVEVKALYICEQNENNKRISENISIKPNMNLYEYEKNKDIINIEQKINNNLNNTKEIIKNSLLENNNDLEKKVNNKIKSIFNEIENNIKNTLKDYLAHTESIEHEYDKKFSEKMKANNIFIENKVKELLCNDTLYEYINNSIKFQITDIYTYVENIINTNMKNEIEQKIILLGEIFNKNISTAFNDIKNNENDLFKTLKDTYNKNNFNIIFDKEQNEIRLCYCDEIISSTKINIKGLIGPKGPDGKKGEKGETPIIKKINLINNKIKFIVQDSNNIYEVISDENIPCGPQGIQGERGEPGKSYTDIKWEQDNVMRIDKENNNSLIFLKSLCIGDKSHCLKDNSVSIAGGKCYQNNSLSIGNESKTLDSESIALFGSCIGKKAFSYRADNIDENCIQFGKKDKLNYNISSFNIVSKDIIFDCDTFKIKTNKYENSKIKELEDKIIVLEKKITDILKKI
jgi:hypothetical protein